MCSFSYNDSRCKFFVYVLVEWICKICKLKFNGFCVNEIFFLLIKEFFDDFVLEVSSFKDDEILFFFLISNKELKEKVMFYKKYLR